MKKLEFFHTLKTTLHADRTEIIHPKQKKEKCEKLTAAE